MKAKSRFSYETDPKPDFDLKPGLDIYPDEEQESVPESNQDLNVGLETASKKNDQYTN